MRTDVAIDKLINIAPIIADARPKLQADEEFTTLLKSHLKSQKDGKGVDNLDFALKFLPVLLKNYRDEVYSILAIWCDKSKEDIANQPFGETVKVIKDLMTDEDFKVFFANA